MVFNLKRSNKKSKFIIQIIYSSSYDTFYHKIKILPKHTKFDFILYFVLKTQKRTNYAFLVSPE